MLMCAGGGFRCAPGEYLIRPMNAYKRQKDEISILSRYLVPSDSGMRLILKNIVQFLLDYLCLPLSVFWRESWMLICLT